MNTIIEDKRTLRAIEKKKVRKQMILEAAQKVFSKNGYSCTSISDIIEEANISRGTFYIYFESLESVFHEIVDSLIEKIMRCIQTIRIEDGRPIEDLRANLERVLKVLFENRSLTAILLKEAVSVDRKVDKKINDLYAFLYRMVRSAVRNGSKYGILREVDPDIISTAFVGSVKETLYQCLVVNKTAVDQKKISDELLSFALRGIRR